MEKKEKKNISISIEKWMFKPMAGNFAMMFVCVLINLFGKHIAEKLLLPFWLDSVGTMITAIWLGPIAAILVGIVTSIRAAADNFYAIPYMGVSVVTGLVVGVCYPREKKKEAFPIVASAVAAGFLAVICSVPFNRIFNGGYTGNIWGNALIDMLAPFGGSMWTKSILGEAFVDVPDKALSVAIAVLVVQIPEYLSKNKNKTAALLVLLVAAGCIFPAGTVMAADYNADYSGISYSADDGLVSSELNAIAQTTDGFIWAGSYSGLYMYDGSKFVLTDLDEKMNSIMQLYADKAGNLWIGTNDSGLARYDTKIGEVIYYDMQSGLASNSIRSLAEDDKGNIYVGTSDKMCRIDKDGTISSPDEWKDLTGVRSLYFDPSGVMAGVTNDGDLFFIRDARLIATDLPQDASDIYYAAVASNGNGSYLVGTSSNYAWKVHLENDTVVHDGRMEMGELSYFNCLLYSASDQGYFFCCENGMGLINEATGEVTELSTDNFNSSVSDVIIDYQNDIWFVSNKQGVIKYAQNPFEDIFAKAGVEREIVNALLIKDGALYVGMDKGLCVIDMESMTKLEPAFVSSFDGVRIRHLMADSAGNIWASTYGTGGLVCIHPDGTMSSYNETSGNTVGNLFRSAIELSDGRILAASTTALNYLADGVVTKTLSEENGLPSAQVLSMVEQEDGTIRIGTDGDGVYLIKDDVVTEHIGAEEGLESLVILKVVPCTGGYIYVTSNALYYDNTRIIKKLNNFPYNNNYDVYITPDGQAWVSSSAGLYVTAEADLLANEEDYNFTLLNHNRGFYSSFTANAKNAIVGDQFFLCCTDGVRMISTETYDEFDENYQIRLANVTVGDEAVGGKKNRYVLPAKNGRVEFDVAVLNFTLSNPLIHIFLEGSDDQEGITVHQNELAPVYFTNLRYGDYVLHVQILDEADEHVVREETFAIHKDAQLFERMYFKVYLAFVCLMFVMFIGWMIGSVREYMRHVRGLQRAATTDPMTGLLNKATSEKRLKEICKEESGTLLMIDLDSFKLVNDLYGHDMGDKILIRFSELIKSQIRPTDLAGRMGGDEFVAFMRNTNEESSVATRARVINDEILKSAKEYMGEDMNIPLGASIGAVVVPDEGHDFAELYKKADKALYTVKQNGKHGYAFYRRSDGTPEEEKAHEASLSELQTILGERNEGKGAFEVDYERMQMIFRIFVRLKKRYPIYLRIAQIRLLVAEGAELTEEIEEAFYELLDGSLRKCDVLARRAEDTFLVLLTDLDNPSLTERPLDRIKEAWQEMAEGENVEMDYEIEMVKGE